MATASPVDVAVNPNNKAQRYVLWGTGRIDAVGGAVPITDGPQWFDRIDQPVAVALHISNWSTGAGYVLDFQGGFHPLNGAPNVMQDTDGDSNTPQQVIGIPFVFNRAYVDWSWDPAGTGQGYVLDTYGRIRHFGGATPPPRGDGPRWAQPVARKLVMQWGATKRAITLDMHGGLHGDWSAPTGIIGPYWPGQDTARDVVVTDWANGRGYVLDLYGAVHPFGGAPPSFGGQYRVGADVARTLEVINPSDPTRFWSVWSNGQSYEWISSSPPTVTAGGVTQLSPASTVTDTTRPTLAWAFSDAQRDSQAEWQVLLFTQSFVTSHSMTNPALWTADALASVGGTNRTTRGVSLDLDLTNGSYRFYVRARDTAGQWSAWSNRGWVQNVPLPATPTGLTATPNSSPTLFQTELSVSTSGTAGDLVRFEYTDDSGATWLTVFGAGAVPRAATATAVDRFAPLGRPRTYRATVYSISPRTASAPSNSATAILPRHTYTLHSTADAALGGEVHAVDPSEWSRAAEAGVFWGLGADYPTIISDGAPKARKLTLNINTQDRGQWETVEALAESDSTLVYRDAFGEVMYCRLVGDWARRQIPAAALPSESTPLRHMHATPLPLVEVAPPVS